jgi:hypothetical protein
MRRLMTSEVNAAVTAAFDAGATPFLLCLCDTFPARRFLMKSFVLGALFASAIFFTVRAQQSKTTSSLAEFTR